MPVRSTTIVEMHNVLRDTPKTGDATNLPLLYALAGLSAVGIAVTAFVGFKKKKKEGTPKHRQSANALIKRLCANYEGGNCLALDDGEPCVCVQSISYSLLCKYFRNAVLPAEPMLEANILGTRLERCVSCGAPILKKGNRKKYCDRCAVRAYKKQQAAYARRKRAESKNRG